MESTGFLANSQNGENSSSGEKFSMATIPKEMRHIKEQLLLHRFVVYAHGTTDGNSPIVEIRPSWLPNELRPSAADISRVLAYIFRINSRLSPNTQKIQNITSSVSQDNQTGGNSKNGKSPGQLTVIVDAREPAADRSFEVLIKGIATLMDWLPESIRRIFWLVANGNEARHDHFSVAQRAFGPYRSAVDLKNVEHILAQCQSAGELYVDLYKRIRAAKQLDLWNEDLKADDVLKVADDIRTQLHLIESSSVCQFVRAQCSNALHHLRTSYANLGEPGKVRTYTEAVHKAQGRYSALVDIMEKANGNAKRFCGNVELTHAARVFLTQAHETINWCDGAIEHAKVVDAGQSASLVRLRLEERRYEQFLAKARARLEAGESLAANYEAMCNADESSIEQATLQCSSILDPARRKILRDTWSTLVDRLEQCSRQLYEARDRLADNLVAYHMLEKVYDWALNNAKYGTKLSILISTAMDSPKFAAENYHQMKTAVDKQLQSYPSEELRQLPSAAVRVKNDQLTQQVDALTSRCNDAERMLQVHRRRIEEIGAGLGSEIGMGNVQSAGNLLEPADEKCDLEPGTSSEKCSPKARSVSPSLSGEYEQPIGRQTSVPPQNCSSASGANENLAQNGQGQDVCWRRRSYAGRSLTPSTSASLTSNPLFPARYLPAANMLPQCVSGVRRSAMLQGTLHEEETCGGEGVNGDSVEMCVKGGSDVITDDLTDQITTCMSESTLKKRLASRKGPGANMPPPPPLPTVHSAPNNALLDRRVRLGSARGAAERVKRPFRKFMKRSITLDDVGNKLRPASVSTASACRLPSVGESAHPRQLHGRTESLSSLASLDEVASRSSQSSSAYTPHQLMPSASDAVNQNSSNSTFADSSGSPGSAAFVFTPVTFEGSDLRPRSPPASASPEERMRYMIIDELMQTELSYVSAIEYVIKYYLPELSRPDLPAELRCQRAAIFGNLERIYDFHVREFLPALRDVVRRNYASRAQCGTPSCSCISANHNAASMRPNCDCGDLSQLSADVATCFLQHRHRFHLYALYNKNKPRCDQIMAQCGAVFFKTKQLTLGDRLDLSSYLLKPVQRMGKYALLLGQLAKSAASGVHSAKHNELDDGNYESENTAELLKRAQEMVTFQLRHGNDLLAMDLIRGCDVNLKEQGTLLRQDEFTVEERKSSKLGQNISWRRNKCSVRRVFLFEHLVLFAKPKPRKGLVQQPGSYSARLLADTYEYKHSMKTSDMGLTESVDEQPCKFELWFRRHTSSTRYVLTAQTAAVRHAWLLDVGQILWRQAIRNREQRQCELTAMGFDRSSCLDLKASADRIEDRAVPVPADRRQPSVCAESDCQSSSNNHNNQRQLSHTQSSPSIQSHGRNHNRNPPPPTMAHPPPNCRPHSLVSSEASSSSNSSASCKSHLSGTSTEGNSRDGGSSGHGSLAGSSTANGGGGRRSCGTSLSLESGVSGDMTPVRNSADRPLDTVFEHNNDANGPGTGTAVSNAMPNLNGSGVVLNGANGGGPDDTLVAVGAQIDSAGLQSILAEKNAVTVSVAGFELYGEQSK